MTVDKKQQNNKQLLTLKGPNKNCSRRHFSILLLSLEKIRLDVSCESSAAVMIGALRVKSTIKKSTSTSDHEVKICAA